ncbi:MAG TPA: metallophosphoesterase, partial [Clostridia bacterium]|nr:metallophosphoesterase [Clostridia bacterium]
HWNRWFNGVEGVISQIDVLPVGGNHETYKEYSLRTTQKSRCLKTFFKVPQNGPEGYKSQVYSFDYGNMHFVILDSQYDEQKKFDGSILETQKKWLDNDLKKTNKPWKIVLFHKSPFPNMPSRPNNQVKAAFQPIFDKYHVDVVFNGHDHCVARTYAINGDKYFDKPSLGTVYYIAGRSGNKVYNNTQQMKWDAFFCNPKDQPSYIIAEMTGNKLVLTAKKQDGELIDTFTIDKSTDTFTPKINK